MKKLFFALIIVAGCQQLKPESIRSSAYPDYEALMMEQVVLLNNSRAKKEVWLDGKREFKVMEMDSASWAKELSFLKEINPSQPEYVGALMKSGDELNQTLTLAKGERGVLKATSYSRSDVGYIQINAELHEDKDVYVHHRNISMKFEDGLVSEIAIDGYQKMMFKDTVRFRINVSVD